MPKKAKPNALQSAETRERLLEAAKKHFAEQGYAETNVEDILADVQLTKGALYHQFGDKRGLFRAVVVALQREIAEKIHRAAQKETDPWEALEAACRTFLKGISQPQTMPIVCTEAYTVLTPSESNSIDEQYSFGALKTYLAKALGADADADALAKLLSGGLYYGVEWASLSKPRDFKRIESTFFQLLRGLRHRS